MPKVAKSTIAQVQQWYFKNYGTKLSKHLCKKVIKLSLQLSPEVFSKAYDLAIKS